MVKRKTEKFQTALHMPPLHHSFTGQEFDILDSHVVQWLIKQPDIAQYVFDRAKTYLLFNPETHKWEGREYGD